MKSIEIYFNLRLINLQEELDYYINDIYQLFEELVDFYPNIFDWFKKKTRERNAKLNNLRILLVNSPSKPIGIIITQNKKDYVKISTLYIKQKYRNQGIGSYIMKNELNYWQNLRKKRFLITVSDKALDKCAYFGYFLEKFNFIETTTLLDHYINGVSEIIFIREALSSPRPIIMSIKPQYSKLIRNRKKNIEIRKKILKHINRNSRIYIYESSPSKAIIGFLEIDRIIHSAPQKIWDQNKREIGISEKQFSNYCQNHKKVYGLFIRNIKIFDYLLKLNYLRQKLDNWNPPQNMNYCSNQLINLLENLK